MAWSSPCVFALWWLWQIRIPGAEEDGFDGP